MQENNRPGPIILDVETTGLSLGDQVIQVCLCDHKDGRLLFHSFAMPTLPIHPNATRRNGIDWQLLEQANARPWPKVWRDLADFLGAGGMVYSYCWPFDKRMIKQTCEAHEIDCSMLNDITWNNDIEWNNIAHQNESEFVSEQKRKQTER